MFCQVSRLDFPDHHRVQSVRNRQETGHALAYAGLLLYVYNVCIICVRICVCVYACVSTHSMDFISCALWDEVDDDDEVVE